MSDILKKKTHRALIFCGENMWSSDHKKITWGGGWHKSSPKANVSCAVHEVIFFSKSTTSMIHLTDSVCAQQLWRNRGKKGKEGISIKLYQKVSLVLYLCILNRNIKMDIAQFRQHIHTKNNIEKKYARLIYVFCLYHYKQSKSWNDHFFLFKGYIKSLTWFKGHYKLKEINGKQNAKEKILKHHSLTFWYVLAFFFTAANIKVITFEHIHFFTAFSCFHIPVTVFFFLQLSVVFTFQ